MSTRRDYPFHAPISEGQQVDGVVLVDQVKSIDFRSRGVKRIGGAPEPMRQEVFAMLDDCAY